MGQASFYLKSHININAVNKKISGGKKMPGFGSNSFILIFILLMMMNGGACGSDNMVLILLLFMMMNGSNFRICDNK